MRGVGFQGIRVQWCMGARGVGGQQGCGVQIRGWQGVWAQSVSGGVGVQGALGWQGCRGIGSWKGCRGCHGSIGAGRGVGAQRASRG